MKKLRVPPAVLIIVVVIYLYDGLLPPGSQPGRCGTRGGVGHICFHNHIDYLVRLISVIVNTPEVIPSPPVSFSRRRVSAGLSGYLRVTTACTSAHGFMILVLGDDIYLNPVTGSYQWPVNEGLDAQFAFDFGLNR